MQLRLISSLRCFALLWSGKVISSDLGYLLPRDKVWALIGVRVDEQPMCGRHGVSDE